MRQLSCVSAASHSQHITSLTQPPHRPTPTPPPPPPHVWKALHADYDIEKRFEALKAKVGAARGWEWGGRWGGGALRGGAVLCFGLLCCQVCCAVRFAVLSALPFGASHDSPVSTLTI